MHIEILIPMVKGLAQFNLPFLDMVKKLHIFAIFQEISKNGCFLSVTQKR